MDTKKQDLMTLNVHCMFLYIVVYHNYNDHRAAEHLEITTTKTNKILGINIFERKLDFKILLSSDWDFGASSTGKAWENTFIDFTGGKSMN